MASGTSRHQFITARMERMGEAFSTLAELVGSPQQAMQIVAETLASPQEPEERA